MQLWKISTECIVYEVSLHKKEWRIPQSFCFYTIKELQGLKHMSKINPPMSE